MMRFRLFTCSLCAAGLLAANGVARPDAVSAAPAAEVRGLWVLRSSLTSLDRIDAVVRSAEAGGFNTLLVQVRGRGEVLYQSAVEPRATDLDGQPESFDPLAVMLAAAHRAGLRVHAWVNVDLVSSAAILPRSHDHVVSRHPDWLMVPKPLAQSLRSVDWRSPAYIGELARWSRAAGATVEGLYLSPVTRESQAYTVGVVSEIVTRYAIDGIHFDYARYPSEIFDYSGRALSEFRASRASLVTAQERQRLDNAAAKDPAAWANMFPEGWAAFRRDRLTTLVKSLHAAVKTARPGVIVSAAVSPNAEMAKGQHLQDWSAWASAGILDAVCPMAYTTDVADFASTVARARTSAAGVPVWAGIGAWQLPVNRTVEHVQAARRAGVAGVLLFSYDALAASASKPPAYFAGLRQVLLGTDRP